MGLTYSAVPGKEDIYRAPGLNDIAVSNMTNFAATPGRFGNGVLQDSLAAHVLGDIGSSYNFSMLPKEPLNGMPWASNPAAFWNATDHWEYNFLDSAPLLGSTGPNSLSIYTDHIVRSTATCETPPFQANISGDLGVIRLLNKNQTVNFPAIALGLESIYYLSTPILYQNDLTPNGENGTCGPGCSNVKVLEPAAGPDGSPGGGTSSPWFYYDCNITVTSIAEDLSPLNAAVAAQAIALSGQIHPEFKSTTEAHNMYISYNFGLSFGEPQNKSTIGMAGLISRFAIGTIAAAAQTNPSKIIQGGQPTQGVRLGLDYPMIFNLILGVTGGIQFILVVVAAIIVCRLVIPDEVLLSHEEEIRKRFVLVS